MRDLMQLDHIQLAIPEGEEDRARAYWAELLGLVEIEKPEALKSRGGLWFKLTGAELHLGVARPFHPARKAHPCFRVGELEALQAKLAEAGYTVQPDATIAGRNRFFTEDPFGNRIAFMDMPG